MSHCKFLIHDIASLRSWRDFARECFCFGTEAVNASGDAVGKLVKSLVEFPRGFAARKFPRGLRLQDMAAERRLTNPASYAGYDIALGPVHK